MIEVDVILALPQSQQRWSLQLDDSACVGDALAAAGYVESAADAGLKFGIFGRIVEVDRRLKHGDRVEIYRPLLADPKQARRRRAAKIRRR